MRIWEICGKGSLYGVGAYEDSEAMSCLAVMLDDDKPLLRITKDGVIAYGTPWDGKHRLSESKAVWKIRQNGRLLWMSMYTVEI